MKNPAKAFETGEMLLSKGDFEMASVYFKNAGENFIEAGDKISAIKAYDKALSCFFYLEENDLIIETQAKLRELRA